MPADDGDFWAVFVIVALLRQGGYCSSIRHYARNWLQLRASSGSPMSLDIIIDSKSFAVIQLLTDLILTSIVGDQLGPTLPDAARRPALHASGKCFSNTPLFPQMTVKVFVARDEASVLPEKSRLWFGQAKDGIYGLGMSQSMLPSSRYTVSGSLVPVP